MSERTIGTVRFAHWCAIELAVVISHMDPRRTNERARQAFADRNPESRRLHDEARRVLPGGHTRTVLAHPPFPLTFATVHDSLLTDADGHTYIDLLGDYTDGLAGHSERRLLDAVHPAMSTLASSGGIHAHETTLAQLMCERFRLERVRFTNSGTEANLMAITTARLATGRAKILVFDGGYHGGVMSFVAGAARSNAPYNVIVSPYNDLPAATAAIEQHAGDLAAVLVEPMLGSAGCIPASAEFLTGVLGAGRDVGAVGIADEVMTSHHGRSGLTHLLGAHAPITTYGKYIGGGSRSGRSVARPNYSISSTRRGRRTSSRRHVQQQRGHHGGGMRCPAGCLPVRCRRSPQDSR